MAEVGRRILHPLPPIALVLLPHHFKAYSCCCLSTSLPPSPKPQTDRGASGIEYAGYSNQIATLADARTDQSAQAIAYPSNVLNPASTLTCTQVKGLEFGACGAWYTCVCGWWRGGGECANTLPVFNELKHGSSAVSLDGCVP